MASDLSPRFYDNVRTHMERGIPLERFNFTPSQRERVLQCKIAFEQKVARPWMDLRQYFANALGHSQAEIINDLRIVNFMLGFVNDGQREVDRFEVRETAKRVMRNSAQNGDDASGVKAAALLTKVERLDQPDAQVAESDLLAGMPIIIHTDVERKYHNKKSRSAEELDAIRKKWGVQKDPWMAAVEIRDEEYVDFEEKPDGEPSGTVADDNKEQVITVQTGLCVHITPEMEAYKQLDQEARGLISNIKFKTDEEERKE